MMKWIEFADTGLSHSGKTRTWDVRTKDRGDVIGRVYWYASWRKYAFSPAIRTVFEQDCLRDIASFVEQATKDHRAAKKSGHRVLDEAGVT